MRSSGCALQQTLTSDAASVVKQSVLLARRRGHAQVTPLHVANTMLSAPSGSFRAACLKSHSHPLQCKALELCFNVALNRLPTSSSSSSSPMLNPHHHTPSISNALVAAFKRAQAHQRRGSVEAQQQTHLLAVKIDLDQLVISILDDPSVSRVMREAGFASTQVKANLEISVSCSPSSSSSNNKEENRFQGCEGNRMFKNEDDVSIVIETLLLGRKRKSLVLVGECVSSLESVVKGLMDKVDKGQVPENLREIKLVTIPPLYTFCNLGREEVEHKVGELTCLVKSVLGRGVVLYLGDFKWISDYRVRLEEEERRYYCSVEHLIVEIGRLVWGIGETERFWLMGIATFQTYIKCRNSSLESVWGLHPVTIPANSLSLGLVSQRHAQIVAAVNGEANLLCCGDCSAKFKEEARNLQCNSNGSTLSELPSWLKDESRRLNNQNQNSEAIKKLRMKWNSFCSSAHKQSAPLEKTLTTLTNFFTLDQQNPGLVRTGSTTLKANQPGTRNLLCMAPEIDGNGFSSTSTTSSSELMEMNYAQKMKEFSAKNLNILCNALEEKFPCHKEIISEIAGTILQCRSGMLRRKDETRGNNNNNNNNDNNNAKQETWMLFLGPDPTQAKEKISKELAKVVFGSYSSFLSVGFVTSSAPSDADCRNKRGRDEDNCKSYLERFCQAVSENPHRVFFLENLEQVDNYSRMGMKRAIQGGKIRNQDGDEFCFRDAVVVLSCESLKCMSASRACSPRADSGNGAREAGEEDESACVSLDLNISFDGVEDRVVDEFGIFENVDRRVVFKIQDM